MNPLSRTDLPLSQIREFVEDQVGDVHLRDAFCLWRHKLNGATGMATPSTAMLHLLTEPFKSVRHLMGNDAIVLCRLAPLAKAYGFTMHIGELEHTLSVQREVYHDYKDSGYLSDDDYSDDDSEDDESNDDSDEDDIPYIMPDIAEVETLGGKKVFQPALLELATEIMERDDLQAELLEVNHEYAVQSVEHFKEHTTKKYTHTRKISVLFISS
ncbi:hypothetical protein B0H11DRAFT_2053030 [Mycena galericulata]|nr:hypothetical protein B0H11DRAFT_2053030 [Mycena galericulata]